MSSQPFHKRDTSYRVDCHGKRKYPVILDSFQYPVDYTPPEADLVLLDFCIHRNDRFRIAIPTCIERPSFPPEFSGKVVQGCTVKGANDANSGIKQATGNDHTRVIATMPGM